MRRFKDLTGMTFGMLEVLRRVENRNGEVCYECRCKCGNIKIVSGHSLKRGNTKSCGCLSKPNLVGKKFGRLKVTGLAEIRDGKSYYDCECDCGNKIIVLGASLSYGNTKSCGCLRKEKFTTKTHGLRHSRIYRIWCAIKTRCYNPNSPNYKNYGGRGITMFEPWINSFELFYEYVSKLPHFGEDGYSLDRENDNGNYEPGNLRWATQPQQARNTRRNVWVEYKGQKMCLKDAAEASGIDRRTLGRRFKSGKVGEELFKPTLKQGGDKNAPN